MLWSLVDADVLLRAAGDAESLERLRAVLFHDSFVQLAEFERARQVELSDRLRLFVDGLLAPLRRDQERFDHVWTRRFVRFGTVVVALGALAVVALLVRAWQDERNDLALGAPWSTSSTANAGACQSPIQVCSESPFFFFHTRLEKDPFVVFDLGREKRLSRVAIENRIDCCTERASPLIVEISSDRKRWKQLVRHDGPFVSFRATFPRAKGRFVRVRIAGNGMLHLARVRLLP